MAAAAACSPPSTSGRSHEASRSQRLHAAARQQRNAAAGAPPARRRLRRGAPVAAAAEKPDWLRDLEETADLDEDAARLLAGANGDPAVVQQRMREEMDAVQARILGTKYGGEDAPMDVSFRAPVNQFSLWVWLELYRPPTGADLELLQEVINSWYLLGRLGAFNSSNLQVLYHQDGDLEELEYDAQEGASMPSTFHDIMQLESRGAWARFWLDMGTADELALDILVNALSAVSREQLGIKRLVVGGANEDWPVPAREDYLPEVTMDPLRGPQRYGGDDDDGDDAEFLP